MPTTDPAAPTTWPAGSIRPGRLTVVQSAGGEVPSLPDGVRVLRVDASQLHGGLSVLAHTEHALHENDLLERIPWPGIRAGIRRRLLGEEPVAPRGPRVLAGLEQLAVSAGRPVVWVIERAHRADPDSRGWLSRQVRHMPGWAIGVVIGVAPDDAWGAGLAAQAEHCFGPTAVVRHSPSATVVHNHPPDPAPPEPPAAAEPPVPATRAEVLAVLRAAATIGRSFSVDALAAVVALPPHRVATLLQEGREAGWELVDAGDQVLRFGRGVDTLLRAGVPRAVAAVWTARWEAHQGSAGTAPGAPETQPPPPEAAPSPPQDAAPSPAPEATPTRAPDPVPEPLAASSDPLASQVPAAPSAGLSDQVRALLSRAADAREHGAWNEAAGFLSAVEQLLPDDALRSDRLGRELRLERTQLGWEATGTGIDLDTALRWAESLATDSEAASDVDMHRRARVLAASIAYDIGDPASLDRSLNHLQATIRDLQDAGEARAAAALLNDQAAVWVRIGDAVRAAHLLQASRRVFAAAETPEDRAELAETMLLLARLVLHVDARPGREDDALEQALDHARQAATLFASVQDTRHVALSRATEGRILLLQGRTDAALASLAAAMETQRALHDVLGLARTANGLAQAMLALDRHEDAVRFLADSMRFNAAAGARRGLAYNRETAGHILAGVPEQSDLALALEGWIDQLG